MKNEYQIGKDIGQILQRLEKLENDDCGCGGKKEKSADDSSSHSVLDEEHLEMAYMTNPLIQDKCQITVVIREDDSLSAFFDGAQQNKLISFSTAETEGFTIYSAITSIDDKEKFENQIEEFLISNPDASMASSDFCCTFYRQRNLTDCSRKRVELIKCRSRSEAWRKCRDKGNSLCPHILRWYSCGSIDHC